MFDQLALKALLVTAIAGLATTIGSLIGLGVKRESPRFMCSVLGFTAGVMVGISFFELLPSSFEIIGFLKSSIAFIAGFGFIFLIDFFIPHEYIGQSERITDNTNKKLLRAGFFIAIGIGIHNLPEGMATFYSYLSNENIGLAIAVAVAIHNIPEGIAVSAPIYKATGKKSRAFLYSFLSGVSEPVGAIITAVFLLPFLNSFILAYTLAAVAGIMAFISIDELVPVSISYGYNHLPILSFLIGIIVMILSLFLLK